MSNKNSFQKILNKYRKYSFSERDKGNKFERLMQSYLQTDPKYAPLFKKVWLWNEFPFKKDFGGKDIGIDIVAETNEGEYWAVQCKCYQDTGVIDKAEVDSFLSTSGRKFVSEKIETTNFTHRLWISTTNKWSSNAEETIRNQHPQVNRISLFELEEAPVEWDKLEKGISGDESRSAKKSLFPHQKTAVDNTHEYFKTSDRGKLIMACCTGKTFTSLKIAEKETDGKGLILFLVPSIALLGQTLREWYAEADEVINAICICSDPDVSKKKNKIEDSDGFSIVDLALPASTNVKEILRQFDQIKRANKPGMTVVFSTYQSIDVISKAQAALIKENIKESKANKNPYGIFDLIICDEAHRTTGVTLSDEEESSFVKVHDNKFIQAKKRIYMTATPRLYNEDSILKAAMAEAVLCSMDDEKLYGEEIYRIGFGEAVERDLLSDYKVLVLSINENDIPASVQNMVADRSNEINSDDASKLIGCINAFSKKILGDEGIIKETDPDPMRRAVAFCQSIKISKKISTAFVETKDVFFESITSDERENYVSVSADHVDGTMSAPTRDEKLSWLKSFGNNDEQNECRVLTNVRCLSEGVDVPSLDAVLFLSARNSQVDVVQSVGRVMRKSPGKKYGYIIIPIVVPADVDPKKALDDNERYKVVWTVLNALRAHDDRFNATINKIELNKKKPTQILVGTPDFEDYADRADDPDKKRDLTSAASELGKQMTLKFSEMQNIVFAKMVMKVGDRRYWENWAKEVGKIAESHIERIKRLIRDGGKHQQTFENFLTGLQKNINPSISQDQAVEMLAQHIITKPVFEALFEGYSFVKNNPISVSMQTMLDLLEEQSLEKDTETLQKFYDSVKARAGGIDNAEGRQKIIVELYDKFFKSAFPKMVEKLGIVYTPVEVVDFMIRSVEDILQKEFGRSLSDENVHILDPFTGTGTFMTRILQSGLIKQKDLSRKYEKELHANELVLLAYYIAAINIENVYHDVIQNLNGDNGKNENADFKPFEGICLTDTFQLGETEDSNKLFSEMFPQNSERVEAQRKAPLRVIIGNPPYSVGQKSANDNAQNQSYDKLDKRISKTYAAETEATNKNSLYDSYFKAFRWSTDRLDPVNGGVIAFVSNGSWLDGNSSEGFRKCLEKEFSSLYVFNLRGNQRTSGELSRREGGKIFGSGSRAPIALSFLIKNPSSKNKSAKISYHDIGDYLTREDKLKKISKFISIANSEMPWKKLKPNEYGDWLNQRNDVFETFIPIGDKDNKENKSTFFIPFYSNGLKTQRDAWCYNCSKDYLETNIKKTIDFYNFQREYLQKYIKNNPNRDIDKVIDFDSAKISWTRALKWDVEKNKPFVFNSNNFVISSYRPFFKQHLYFSRNLNEMVYQMPKLFPNKEYENKVICVPGAGDKKDYSVLITNTIPDLGFNSACQCFPLYYYEEQKHETQTLFDDSKKESEDKFIRRDGVSDFILGLAKKAYGNGVTKEDIFYYVYGLLHSPDYRTRFANDLKKMLPRIPLVDEPKDFWKFSRSGRQLADIHIGYEDVPPADGVIVTGAQKGNFRVVKMRFPSKTDKSKILYNSDITIENIPSEAYDYIVNGRSAIEWIMERYQIKTDKASGITNDPNDWAEEVGNPRYILDLLLSIIRVSVETIGVVRELPKLKIAEV